MGAEANQALHSKWLEAENLQDLSHHDDFVHDDIEVDQGGVARVMGIVEYRQMMEVAYASIPDFHTVLHDQIATDDRVVARWTTSGTHSGDSLGVPATGKPIEFSGLSIWQIEDGKARRGWIYSSLPIVLMQLAAP